MDVAAFHILDQAVQLLVQVAVIQRQRVLEARTGARAQREQQRVVGELLASLGVDDAPFRVEPLEGVLLKLDADVARDLVQGVAARYPPAERLSHAQGAVDEVGLGRQQRGADQLPCEIAQCERASSPATPPPAIRTRNGVMSAWASSYRQAYAATDG